MHDGEFCQHIDEFSIEGIFVFKVAIFYSIIIMKFVCSS